MHAIAPLFDLTRSEVSDDPGYLGLILNRLDHAVLVVGSRLDIHFANDFALRVCARRDAIAIENHRLAFLSPAFQRRVMNLTRPTTLRAALPRSSGERDYLVAIHSFEAATEHPQQERFLVEIHEAVTAPIAPDVLRELFGLTATEAIVASSLTGNCDVNELSRQLEVSTNTIRTHIRSIYAKCEVQSLPQLMQLFAICPR